MSGEKKIWLIALAYWLVASSVASLCYPILISDTIYRYVSMANAFAAGDFMTAFHPRFGILLPALAGSITWLCGIAAEHACQIVAFGFTAAATVPAWYILRKLFDEEVALWVALAMLFMPEFVVYSLDGLRESMRMFGVMMVVAGFLLSMRSWMTAIGIFVMATSRADVWVVAMIFYGMWVLWCLYKRMWLKLILPTLLVVAANALLISVTYAHTGKLVPYAQMLWMASRNYIKWI